MQEIIDNAANKEWLLILPRFRDQHYYHSTSWSKDYISVTFVPDTIYKFTNLQVKNSFIFDKDCLGTMTISMIGDCDSRDVIHTGKHKFSDVIEFVNKCYENIPEQEVLDLLPPVA